jgi:hypothetical protein
MFEVTMKAYVILVANQRGEKREKSMHFFSLVLTHALLAPLDGLTSTSCSW